MSNDDAYAAGGAFGMVFVVVLWLAMIGFGIYMYMRVARKAGWPASYGLLCFVPIVNIVVLIMFVFTEWPIEREVARLRQELAARGGYLPGAPGPYGALPPGQGYSGYQGHPAEPIYPVQPPAAPQHGWGEPPAAAPQP